MARPVVLNSTLNLAIPYFIISTSGSRSPNEYLQYDAWDSRCHRGDGYQLSQCIRSNVVSGTPPPEAAWWFVPEAGSSEWYYIVAGRESSYAGYNLGPFNGQGDVYPQPYYLDDAEYLNDEMPRMRFRFEMLWNADARERQYYIITSPQSSMDNEMIFLNRAMGDWLDTWTIDLNDAQARWRLEPVPCSESRYSNSCLVPDYQAAWDRYNQFQWWWILVGGLLLVCCFMSCFSKKRGSPVRELTRRRFRGASASSANEGNSMAPAADPPATRAVAVAVAQPVVPQAGVVVVTGTAVPV